MSEPQITWPGTTPDELARKLGSNGFLAVREATMPKILLVMLGAAQRGTPVRTGTLRRSETTRVEDRGARGYLGSNITYAPFVHARVPFFADAITSNREQALALLQKAAQQYLEDASQ